jgi:mono/diheme cytochrome c family protein
MKNTFNKMQNMFSNESKKIAVKSSALVAVVLLAGCNIDKSKPNIELIQDMMVTDAVKAQRPDPGAPNGIGMREPVVGTVPVGYVAENLTDLTVAEKELKNPLVDDMSKDVLMTGQKFYVTNCGVCHGNKGEGAVAAKLTIADFMPLKPWPINNDKISGWTDAHIYFVISKGQGLMGPYASHIPQKYRWQVVNYIRHLQKEAKK